MIVKKVVKFDNDEVNSAETMQDIKQTVCQNLMNGDCAGCPFECCCDNWDDILAAIVGDGMLSVED